MDTGVRSARNELFQTLKPRCVELSQLALKDDGSPSDAKSIAQSTARLLAILEQKCKRTDGVFDEKLADYVFFPLSQILKKRQKYTDGISELTTKCLRILLEFGWSRGVALDLAKQLLILLSFVAGGRPDQKPTNIPEEIASEAYGALAALFNDLRVTPGGSAALVETGTIPALGHCITVILEGITDGASVEVQLQALSALDATWRCIKDMEALATFLPGTISALTKSLMPGTGTRRPRKVLVTALGVLGHVLTSVLSDIRTRNIRNKDESPQVATGEKSEQKVLSKSWLKATTGQIKLALANIIRLRKHDADVVRKALNNLCLTILDECHDTLSESASLLVETCMILEEVGNEANFKERGTTLVELAIIYPDVGELVKTTAYNWVTSLPRVMQANDESAKKGALEQLQRANNLLKNLNSESSILEDALGSSLRDSITVTLEALPSSKVLQEAEFDPNSQAAMTLVTDNTSPSYFSPVILAGESQKETRETLMRVLSTIGTQQSQTTMAGEMLEYVRIASGPSLLAAYWLSFQILKTASSQNEAVDEFLDASVISSDEQDSLIQELMSYSQSILASTDDGQHDWRMQAIALEVVAERAQQQQTNFRPELIDTLYPVAQLLGSPNNRLREHAITCLNIVSKACGYANASDLIIDNVDYMVNAIALRLNTFDISPQAPQVLVMMIRLAGPSLLPYLDDAVGSIFAALDNFHGYQRLVEVLFSVLDEVVKVGSKSIQLQITTESTTDDKPKETPIPTIEDIIALLTIKPNPDADILPNEDFPREPWKSAQTLLNEHSQANKGEDEEEEPPPPSQELAKPPPTKTYTLLQSITRLSQHYLTSSSPTLRTKLLSLIATASPALSHSPEDFLPLVNDIWPVLIKRIYDSETYVAIAGMDTVSGICQYAGDFMRTRISVEWSGIIGMARRVRKEMEGERKGSAGRGVYAEGRKKWESVVRLLCAVAEWVRVEDAMFDDVVEVLGSAVWERSEVRRALETVNADAIWLACYVARMATSLPTQKPYVEGYEFVALRATVY
ncbi:ARM repeat-containing protein [Venustampulla echinocandica]|uniref:ARM repeat-containing protein n=1 Tax=Venustampulla echinocandica TaxID=2656787 RepID=A0A370T9B5_9HELO|nr:ARM repeat-containing protein [Venustampulla echinocandica]RDL30162.1 ARM repeat-containing protein [Venustampulla echinocandica]